MIRIGDIWIADSLLGRFNCGHYVLGETNRNKYCPRCLDEALSLLLLELEAVNE